MDIFVSPMATVFARNVAFLSGSVLAVLILLTVWDEDVINVEHVIIKYLIKYYLKSYSLDVDNHDYMWSIAGWV